MPNENPIFAAAVTLSNSLEREIKKLKDVTELDDFERRTKSLLAMSKAVQTFNDFVRQLKTNSKGDDGSVGPVVEFRQELARRIRSLVKP